MGGGRSMTVSILATQRRSVYIFRRSDCAQQTGEVAMLNESLNSVIPRITRCFVCESAQYFNQLTEVRTHDSVIPTWPPDAQRRSPAFRMFRDVP